MKKILLGFYLFIFAASMAQTKQEQEVLQLSAKKFTWLVAKKIDSLNFVSDERLTFIHSNGWVQTKKELLADLQSGKLNYVSIDVSESSVRLYPKSAVVNGKGKFVATVDGNTNTVNLSYTETYVLQKREWKLASRHASRLP